MKILASAIFVLSFCTLAAEKYGVYDLKGNRVSTFEAEWFDLPEKTKQVKQKNPHKNLYVSSFKKGKGSKPTSRYRYKAETGAYIEAAKKETFSICPEKEIEGTWISEHSVYLNSENCLSVYVPNLAGTFRVLFMENSGLTDTIQVLVEQSYIQMGDYSHKIWVTDLDYESRSYSQPLIVDKTKFTMGDALYYHKIDEAIIAHWTFEEEEYKNKKLEESNLPLVNTNISEAWRFANMRSKKGGLDTAYIIISPHSEDSKKFILLGNPLYNNCKSCTMLALDTSASGYRLPFEAEWFFLMHTGTSTCYEWVRPIGLKPIAQRQPNGFGLYDMAGIADEYTHYFHKEGGYWDSKMSCGSDLSPECTLINEIGPQKEYVKPSITECVIEAGNTEWKTVTGDGKCTTTKPEIRTQRVYYQSLRLLRKTPKLHKLEKF